MNPRIVAVPLVVAIAAAAIWWQQRSTASGAPAATWRLGSGTEVVQGRNYDELPADSPVRLSFTSEEPLWVYVFSHSAEDGTLLLFPSPQVQSDLVQPLPAGQWVLPGRHEGKELAWTTRHQILATTTFLVVAARERLADLDALLPRLRRWTNTAVTDRSMQVMHPPEGGELAGAPRQPLPHPLLQRAADASITATVVNGPLTADPVQPGIWTGSWRVKEQPKR